MAVSSFYGLQTALRGLLAEQRSIDVTGHNIANATTTGYTRQEATLRASDPTSVVTGAGLPGSLGSGVDVVSYRRIRDGFLDAQYRAQSMNKGYQETMASSLGFAEEALAEPGDNGIASQLSDFWDAWSNFASDPGDTATRTALVQKGATLASTFKSVDDQLAALQRQVNDEYATLTGSGGEVATIAKELGMLNGSIASAISAGDSPNDLLDRRDVLMDRLSELGQVSVTARDDGSVTVAFGDAANPLIEGTAVDWPQSLTAPGGKLGALKALGSDGGKLAGYRSQLAGVAETLAGSVNGLHAAPPFFTFTAGNAAATLAVGVTAGQVSSSSTANVGANDLATAVAALRSGAGDAAYRTFVTSIGTDVDEANRLQANAAALTASVDDRRSSVSGVSLDEEMTNLVRFQRAYQASARAMSTMDDMLDQLINRTGRVGL